MLEDNRAMFLKCQRKYLQFLILHVVKLSSKSKQTLETFLDIKAQKEFSYLSPFWESYLSMCSIKQWSKSWN